MEQRKYRRYKNGLEKFLDSNKGRRFFNIVYSVGAAVVILGAMFKILHLPFGDQMLMTGMITEACVFLLSAFEKPGKEYKWEEVYPVLAEDNAFIPKVEREMMKNKVQVARTDEPESRKSTTTQTATSQTTSAYAQPSAQNVTTGSTQNQSNITNRPSQSVNNNISANRNTYYNDTVAERNAAIEQNTTNQADIKTSNPVASISDSVLESYHTIIETNTKDYLSQVETLNRNISGLNTIYEIQLKGVSGQINTIEEINAGLDRMRQLYSGSLADSSIFKSETEKMAKQLAELNVVYARLLQAMTTNMGNSSFPANNNNQQP